MKFKKIEISAFRIYDNPENATFDFSTKSGDIASFVSLYAPNGFGKTSFYDAVEWGVTNNIQRFWQNRGNTDQSIEALRGVSENQIKLWRNTSSIKPTYVSITTNQGELPKRELSVHGKSISDITKFDLIDNSGFRQVILSQEWIAAFLREVNGEDRYKKFMENSELSEINNYYNNLKIQYLICNDSSEQIKKEISEFNNKIMQYSNENILENINSEIILLRNEFGDTDLQFVTLETTQSEIQKFNDMISTKIISSDKTERLEKSLENITLAKIGNEKIIGASTFFENVHLSTNLKNRISEIKIFIDKFKHTDELLNRLKNFQNSILQNSEEKEKINNLITTFGEYEKIKNSISQKIERKKFLESNTTKLNGELEEINRTIINVEAVLKILFNQVKEINEKILSLPVLENQIFETDIRIKHLRNTLDDEFLKIRNSEASLKEYDESINRNKNIIKKVLSKEYDLLNAYNDIILINVVEKLIKNHEKIKQSEAETRELDLIINQQNELNSVIQDFINSGLNIVNESKTSTCPLCEQTYDSFNQLAQKISNNSVLNDSSNKLAVERNVFINQRIELLSEIERDNNLLEDYYTNKIKDFENKKKELLNSLNVQRETSTNISKELNSLITRYNNYNTQLQGLTKEDFKRKLQKLLFESERERDKSLNILENEKSQKNEIDRKIEIQKKEIFLLNNEIENLKINEKYVSISDWFMINYPNQEGISLELLIDYKENLIKTINETTNKIELANEDIKIKQSELQKHTLENLINQEKELEDKFVGIQFKIETYIIFLKEKLGIDVSSEDKESLLNMLKLRELQYNSDLEKNKSLINEYKKLENYTENIFDFLQSEVSKLARAKKEKELNVLVNNVEPTIKKEKEKVKEYLKNKVQIFFNEVLTNKLYEKIDPHPDYKNVVFSPNFDAEKPRLDVFVRNEKNEKILIPNLYFSTAQINILSLCIFLASALNSKEYDCIFIDDPIQSMDSINVLSTIDLLRSIVVNYDKQIILSTHDENFHNLLKKKMPPELFKSKFLELESFGKVKKDSF